MSEETIIRHIPPCSSCDLEALESWLTDLAREGHHLQKIGSYTWHFTKGEPKDIPYRLIPGRKKAGIGAFFGVDSQKLPSDPRGTQLEQYAAMGWEYVARHGHFFIFRGIEDYDGILRPDPRLTPEDFKAAEKHEWRQYPFLLITILVVLPGFLYAVSGWWGQPLLFLSESLGVLLFTLLIALVYSLHRVFHLLQLRKLRSKLENGFRLDHKKDWKKAASRNRAAKVSFLLFITFWSVALSLLADVDRDYDLLEDYPGDPPFPVLEELVSGEYLDSGDGMYSKSKSLLIPVHIEWWENGIVPPRWELYYRPDYYETLTPAMARELAEELLHQEQKDHGYTTEPLVDLGLDYAVVFNEDRTVILQEGTKVMRVTLDQGYNREIPLEVWTAALAESIASDLS